MPTEIPEFRGNRRLKFTPAKQEAIATRSAPAGEVPTPRHPDSA